MTTTSQTHVLVVDDDADLRQGLRLFLTGQGYAVHEAGTVAEGRRALDQTEPDIVLVDLQLPDDSGLTLVSEARSLGAPCCVLVISGHGSIEAAVAALHEGADNFVTKPIDFDVLLAHLSKAREALQLRRHALLATSESSSVARLRQSRSPALAKVLDMLPAVAANDDTSVLITGESGSGKTLLARAVHELSPRSAAPFVEVNCSTLSRELLESELFGHAAGAFTGAVRAKAGLIEVADRGSLFLDEIGDMELSVQPKLLKVIEDRRLRRVGSVREHDVDVRVIAATHFDLEELSRRGEFRDDLRYRLDVLRLELPPLRDRREDVADLARVFLEARRGRRGTAAADFTEEAIAWLEAYRWPGNVRELRNLVERAAVHAGEGAIRPEHFGVTVSAAPTQTPAPSGESEPAPPSTTSEGEPLTLRDAERLHVARILASVGGNRTHAAEALGVTRQTLLRKIRAFGLD